MSICLFKKISGSGYLDIIHFLRPHQRVAGMQGYAMNLRNPIFQSRKVRAAIALAFDFEWSNSNLFYGQYTRNEVYFDNNRNNFV